MERRRLERRHLRQLQPAATSPSSSPYARATRRYNAISLEGAPNIDANVAYVACRSPISNPYTRRQQAEKVKRDTLIKGAGPTSCPGSRSTRPTRRKCSRTSAPHHAGRARRQRPALGAKEARGHVPGKFADTYRAAGGDVRYELFVNSEHEWTGKPGPQTNRADEMVKSFVGRNLSL